MSVEVVKEYKYLGTVIDDQLNWNSNTTKIYKKANQRLYFVRKLKYFNVNTRILNLFYQNTVLSLLTFCAITWFNSLSVFNRQKLVRITKQASRIIGSDNDGLQELVKNRLMSKFHCILSDNTHPLYPLIVHNKSGRIRQLSLKTNRFKNSFLPIAIHNFNCDFIR